MISREVLPAVILLAMVACIAPVDASEVPGKWSWQEPHALVHETGDISWQPRAFEFRPGESVRYIDYDSGDDSRAGDSVEAAWKHHPWDAQATGQAAACRGIHTYVFKRGVIYRGALQGRESGRADNPIRLTSDPAWGTGEAVISGSERVAKWTKGADHKDIPQPQEVWYADLDFAPRCVWTVDGEGLVVRIPLARTPNWTVTDADDVRSQWWHWDYRGARPFDNTIKHPRGHLLHLGMDSVNLTEGADYYQGAILWTEHGWVMGGPYPVQVETVDTQRRGLGFGGRWGGIGDYKIVRFNRYYLEDKPHYLDDPQGEFWFDRKGGGGRLYLRLPGGADPNDVRIEAARRNSLIDSAGMSHVYISALAFRFTNPHWRLDGVPYVQGEDLYPACVKVLGAARDVRVSNCVFEHVQAAVRMMAVGLEDVIDEVAIEDNELRFVDRGGIYISDGSPWGEFERRTGLLHDVRVMRNYLSEIGLRPTRFELGFAINLQSPRTVEIAGNVIERCYAGGINVHGGKRGGSIRDVPLSRILIHHNKVVDSLLRTDDFGGIETWQGGPAYVFNNISGNPGGYRNFHLLKPGTEWTARFGFAYYLDGAFKNYYFNNIAWGKSNDPHNPQANRAAFQEIYGFQNSFFNNTAFNFTKGSRRQRPEAGRNKYLGNIFQNISMTVFRHSDRLGVDPNIQDAGQQEDDFDYPTGANSRNVFFGIEKLLGTFEAEGGDYADLKAFSEAQTRHGAIAGDVGVMAAKAPLPSAAAGDFRPGDGSAAAGQGVKVFVPWALHAEVAEWNFYHAGNNPGEIIDEHWYMTPYYIHREDYRHRPRYPLTTVNVAAGDYVTGPLEDWVAGALKLNGRDQYAMVSNARLTEPFEYVARPVGRRGEGDGDRRTAAGEELKSAQIHRSSFVLEVYFRTEPGHTGGVLVEKMGELGGYSLAVNDKGGVNFALRGNGQGVEVAGVTRVNDGQWHHVIAEADRAGAVLTLYIDGRSDAGGKGFGPVEPTLVNDGDLYVGGTPQGRYLAGALEFMRIAQGTLADAQTTVEELYAWQFDGPQMRDFTGRRPAAARRTAGAIEAGR